LTVYFIDAPVFYERPGLYQAQGVDYSDNAERFIFFSKAIAHLGRKLPWRPEVVHLHDWQTGFAALFLRHWSKGAGQGRAPRTCMTIHNLAYQGLFPSGQYPLTNLPWDYFTPAGVEFYGRMSCLKAGLAFGDVITAVSPRYAREIMTPEFGCGLDGLLRHRRDSLFGILNGVDYEEWNPVSDPHIFQPYSADSLEGKAANKHQLQQQLGLPTDPAIPLLGSIGRLVDQKGVDIMLGALQEMLNENMQLALIGNGAPACEKAFQQLAASFPAKASVRIGFDEAFSHQIEAACDFFLMPSRFEPCGLNQMYSLRYGTIPIVRATGGLDDTVIDIREDPQKANGIKFHDYSAAALAKAIRKALALFNEAPLFHQFRINGMAADFSWTRTAAEYVKVYERAVAAS
jgi:starch synthase